MKYSLQKRISAFVLAFALVMTTAFNSIGATTSASAAVKVKAVYKSTNAKAATVVEGTVKTFKIGVWTSKAVKKATVKKKLKVTSSNTDVVEVTTKTIKATQKTKKNAKKAGKASVFQYTAVKAGTATITAKYGKKKASFKVTVTAKSEPASSDASKEPTPAAVKLEKINVTADPATITEGGLAQVKATSATSGAEIFKVEYKSSNTYTATVDETGKVTGQHPGVVDIEVTAYDAFNNAVKGSVSITVTELIKSTITLDEADKVLDMIVGQTKTVKPQAKRDNGTNPELVYTSKDTNVCTVSGDGTIAAVGEGSTTVVIVDKGTTGTATITVNVSATGIGIVSLQAVHANSILVNLTKAVASADRKNLNIALSGGGVDNVKYTASWDATGKSVELVANDGNFSATTYTVKLSSTVLGMAKAEELSKEIKIDALTAKAITIKKGQVVPYSSKAKIYYTVVDQYGDAMKIASSSINWNVSGVKFKSVNNKNSAIVTAADVFNYVTIDLTQQDTTGDGSTYAMTNANKTTLNISASVGTASDVTTFSVEPVGLKSASAVGVVTVSSNGSEIISDSKEYTFKQTAEGGKLTLRWTGIDSNGAEIDKGVYTNDSKTNAYSDVVYVNCSDSQVTLALDPTTKDYSVTIPNTVTKDFTIKFTAGVTTSEPFTVHVIPMSTVAGVKTVSSEATIQEGGALSIPVTFVDQYGSAISKTYANGNDFESDFNVYIEEADNLTTATKAALINYTGNGVAAKAINKGFLTLGATGLVDNSKLGSYKVRIKYAKAQQTVGGAKYEDLVINVKVDKAASAKGLTLYDTTADLKLIQNQTKDIKFYVHDTYTKAWNTNTDDNKLYVMFTNEAGTDLTINTMLTDGALFLARGKVSDTVGNAFKGTVNVTTSSSNVFADKKFTATLYKAATANTVNSTRDTKLGDVTIKISSKVAPAAFSLAADQDSYTSGSNVKLTIKALKQAGGVDVVDTYAGSQKNVKVYEWQADSAGSVAFTDAINENNYVIRDIIFENGVATVTVPATTITETTPTTMRTFYSLEYNGSDGLSTAKLLSGGVKITAGTYTSLNLRLAAGGIVVEGFDGNNKVPLTGKNVKVNFVKSGESTNSAKEYFCNVNNENTVTLDSNGMFYYSTTSVPGKLTVTYVKDGGTAITGSVDVTGGNLITTILDLSSGVLSYSTTQNTELTISGVKTVSGAYATSVYLGSGADGSGAQLVDLTSGSNTVSLTAAGTYKLYDGNTSNAHALAATSVTVSPVVTSIVVTGSDTLTNTDPVTYTAAVKDQFTNNMTNQTVTWSSTATDVATVDGSTGAVTAVSDGSTTIKATVGTVHGDKAVNVALVTP